MSKHILLVEDDTEISDLLSTLLSKEGFTVSQTFDGEQGEQAALSQDFDVIILGAGAAGLTAGYDLHYSGVSYTILEASDRLGGRLQKLEGFASFPIDIGGEWIHLEPARVNSSVWVAVCATGRPSSIFGRNL